MEKQIDQDRQKAERIADTQEKAFADEVLRMLQSAWQSQLDFGHFDRPWNALGDEAGLMDRLVVSLARDAPCRTCPPASP
ncbi:hypothetical protein FV242_32070, partial [Methylobacterium sp. WL64]|uniref:hypothetical protein n=1 Tax=Methylobacterium sp. WL64 TaxID=2603894 RepID=UPI0011D52DE0